MIATSYSEDSSSLFRSRLLYSRQHRLPILLLFLATVALTMAKWAVVDGIAFTHEDSGEYLVLGQRILAGDRLYVDIWGNKPPLIFYINAVGIKLSGGSPVGVLALCYVAIGAAYYTVWRALKNNTSHALIAIVLSLGHMWYLALAFYHPNYTETFAMPLQAAALILAVRETDLDAPGKYAWAQGLIAAGLFFLRPNLAGASVVYLILNIVRMRRRSGQSLRSVLKFVLLACVASLVLLAPVFYWGTSSEFYHAAFQMAGLYSAENTLAMRLTSLARNFITLTSTPFFYVFGGLSLTIWVFRRAVVPSRLKMLAGAALWLFVEVVLSMTSGYPWLHYSIPWIVPSVFITILGGDELLTLARMKSSEGPDFIKPPISACLVFSFLSIQLGLITQGILNARSIAIAPVKIDVPAELARIHVHPGDTVSTWGTLDHNFFFKLRLAPGAALFHEGAYTNRLIYRELVQLFLRDLGRNKPRVIIERRSCIPLFAPPDPDVPLNDAFPARYFSGWETPSIAAWKQSLARDYVQAAEVGGFSVFVRK